MLSFVRTHWRHFSSGLLALAVLGAAGPEVYRALNGDCCRPGASCCHPGSPCCHHATTPATPGK